MFARHVAEDPFVLYHGTSWEVAERARHEGLRWQATIVSRGEAVEVVRIFKDLEWHRTSGNGWAILSSCTVGFDFAAGDTKPIFLAPNDHRARRYAKRRCAGGETATAMRNALGDLRRLATEPDAYAVYLADLARLRSTVNPPSQTALSEWLAGFAEIERRCQEPYDRFTAGAVIAVRFEPDALDTLEFHGMHGVMAHSPIAPHQIIAIDRVEESEPWDMFDESALSAHERHGIIAALRANGKRGLTNRCS
jgi:hypothetical protein